MEMIETKVDPGKIMQVGMGFFASKTLLTAVKLDLFTILSEGSMSGNALKNKIGLQERGLYDFLDGLVSLGFLNRMGLKEKALYSNTEETDLFLDKTKPTYIGGILELANNRLYGFWNNLEEALRTGQPQNELKYNEKPIFEQLYANEELLKSFILAMAGVQMGNFIAFSKKFDFSNYHVLCDVGGAGGNLSIQVALNNPHMRCISFDLPKVTKVANENIDNIGLAKQLTAHSGDFFADNLPKADVITMGNVLHDWNLEQKKLLIKKAYDALPIGGAFVVIENIIDDNRSQNVFGFMMSLNMLIETDGGYDFSAEDMKEWTEDAGFSSMSVMPLTGPASAVIAIK
jgi:precorrin-6B methylase 2